MNTTSLASPEDIKLLIYSMIALALVLSLFLLVKTLSNILKTIISVILITTALAQAGVPIPALSDLMGAYKNPEYDIFSIMKDKANTVTDTITDNTIKDNRRYKNEKH